MAIYEHRSMKILLICYVLSTSDCMHPSGSVHLGPTWLIDASYTNPFGASSTTKIPSGVGRDAGSVGTNVGIELGFARLPIDRRIDKYNDKHFTGDIALVGSMAIFRDLRNSTSLMGIGGIAGKARYEFPLTIGALSIYGNIILAGGGVNFSGSATDSNLYKSNCRGFAIGGGLGAEYRLNEHISFGLGPVFTTLQCTDGPPTLVQINGSGSIAGVYPAYTLASLNAFAQAWW